MTQRLFSRSTRSFGHPPFCLLISPPASLLKYATEDWLMPIKAITLRVETPLLSCTKAWGLMFWRQRRHTATNNSPNCTSHTLEARLHNAQEPHDVLNYVMHTEILMLEESRQTKASIVTLTNFNISFFRNPEPFSLFGFIFTQLITWTLALIT